MRITLRSLFFGMPALLIFPLTVLFQAIAVTYNFNKYKYFLRVTAGIGNHKKAGNHNTLISDQLLMIYNLAGNLNFLNVLNPLNPLNPGHKN